MGRKLIHLTACLLALLATSPAFAAGSGCRMGRVAELPVVMEGLTPIVTLKVNGVPARFIADTGAFFSMVTPAAGARFKLRPRDLPVGFYLGGAVGRAEARLGQADEFTLAGNVLHKVDFLIAGESLGPQVDGLLGQNIFERVEAEFDLANGVIRLYTSVGCERANLAYWAQGASLSVLSIDAMTPEAPHVIAAAQVNGRRIRAAFDTGAGRSILKLGAAVRAGATIQSAIAQGADVMHGVGPREVDSYILPFDSFVVGDETIKNTRLRVAKGDFSVADMLIGADFFLSHRVLISPSQRKIYFTYNGGPVFRLDDAPKTVAKVSTEAPDAGKAVGAAGAAGEFERKGAAMLSRRDFRGAIDQFDHAITAEPGTARLYYARSRARLGAGDKTGGEADLDQAIKLLPSYSEALVARGFIRLAKDEAAGADADFNAALASAGPDSDLAMTIADAYLSVGRFQPALDRYDAWLAAHPKSMYAPAALNGRCWTRALWGRDLDKALADCDQALRSGSRLSGVLDSRGLVHLRRGEFDKAIADYDAAIALRPKSAWSLYGRGLAKLKKGDAAGGRADMDAARAIEPDMPEDAKRFGLTEESIVSKAS